MCGDFATHGSQYHDGISLETISVSLIQTQHGFDHHQQSLKYMHIWR